VNNSQPSTIDSCIDQAILWLTLGALVVLPLVFNYFSITAIFNELKNVTLHLMAGLILILWSWQIVLRRVNARSIPENQISWDLMNWAGRNPARWALVGAAVWVFAQLASTLLSPLPIISFFGGEDNRSGYNLYDSLSLFVIFASVAIKLRTIRSLELLTYTLVLTGTIAAVYGIAQHFGWDPIGGNEGRTRVISSFGNTLNFGGYMVMSIPATLALTYKKVDNKWLGLAIVTAALSLQLAGIWFSGGRGPFVAGSASIISFFVIAIALGGTKQTIKSIGVIVVSTLIAASIIALPSEQGDIGLERVVSIASQFNSETSSTNIEGGLEGRFNIWGSTLKQAIEWNLPITEPTANKLLRPLFGVGPDMFIYAFPLVGQPQTRLAMVDHAHNYELQVLMEQGFVGLFGFLMMGALLAIAIFVIVRRVRRSSRVTDAGFLLILALLPAVVGKMFEMQTGIGRIADLAMNFALFGATIAIYEIMNRNLNEEVSESLPETPRIQSSLNLQASNQTVLISGVVVALTVTTVVSSLFVSWDLRRLSASRALVIGFDHPIPVERSKVWTTVQQRTPEREEITQIIFKKYLKTSKEQFEQGNEEEAFRLLNIGREMLLKFEQRDPLELDTQLGLSMTASTLLSWGYNEFAEELAARSVKLAEGNPAYPSIVGTAATAITSVGLHELAIEYADAAIATEGTTQPWSKAWYAKGRALFELGREEEAIEVLITATEKQPGAEGALLSHQVLAQIYEQRGEAELFELHKELGAGEITTVE
jgi:O-antigen ligase